MSRRGIALTAFAVLVVCAAAFRCCHGPLGGGSASIDGTDTARVVTVRDTLTDTVIYRRPIAHDSFVVRCETVQVAICQTEADTLAAAVPESVRVCVPISSRVYADSTYRAYISGYRAQLDSIEVYPRTVTATRAVTTTRRRRWGVGLQGGYGFTPKGLQPYVGVGVSFNLF